MTASPTLGPASRLLAPPLGRPAQCRRRRLSKGGAWSCRARSAAARMARPTREACTRAVALTMALA
eukprot:9382905-Lingulodinium_polyedra.AAC.1